MVVRISVICNGSNRHGKKFYENMLGPKLVILFFFRGFQCLRKDEQIWDVLKSAQVKQNLGFILSRDLAYQLVHECSKLRDLELVKTVQSLIVHSGLDSVAVFGNHFIRLHVSYANLAETSRAFGRILHPDQYTWNSVLCGYTKLDERELALCLFDRMQQLHMKPDKFAFSSVLKTCSHVEHGRCIHEQIMESNLQSETIVGNAIIDMYCKCGCMLEAQRALDGITDRNVVSWGAIILGFNEHAEGWLALEYYRSMQNEGIRPDKFTFPSILKSCGDLGLLEHGRYVHEQVIDNRLQYDIVVGNSIADMYAKCGSLDELHMNLHTTSCLNWSTMVALYAQNGNGHLALEYFEGMQRKGLKLSKETYLSALKACRSVNTAEHVKYIHEHIIRDGLQSDIAVASFLIGVYSSCERLKEARRAFDNLPIRDVIAWNIMITGYTQNNEGQLALESFDGMYLEGIEPDKFIFSTIIKACSAVGAIQRGRCIHENIMGNGMKADVTQNALIDMYAKCGSVQEACSVFNKLTKRDIIAWASMLGGYAQNGASLLALKCFEDMQCAGISPDWFLFPGILKACGELGAIVLGRHIHEQIIESRIQPDIVLGNSIVDMYANCGSLEEASKVFGSLSNRSVGSWTIMISGYGQDGNALLAMQCFQDIGKHHATLDGTAFVGILSAFSHAGLVEEALQCFKTMKEYYAIEPDIDHVNCVVNVLGVAGYFNQADCILKTAFQPDVCLWSSLLNSCRIHNNVDLARKCFDSIISLNPHYAAAYDLLSNIYASAQER